MKFALLLCLILAASTSSGAPLRGGQDGGGGEAPSSTVEQVRTAILHAYKLATASDINLNIFKRFWLSEIGIFWTEDYFNPRPLFPTVANKNFSALEPTDFSSPVLEGLATRPPQILEQGDCPQSTREHADASVSEYTPDGTVCFSIAQLKRFPPEDLLGETLALLLHESIHLGGVRDEKIAESWQNRFRKYYQRHYGIAASDHSERQIKRSLAAGLVLLDRMTDNVSADPADPTAKAQLGELAVDLIIMPNFLDPLTLELTLKPAKPELYNNYANAVIATYEKTEQLFKVRELTKSMIDDLRDDFLIAFQNYDAYAHGNMDTVCLLPKASRIPPDMFNYLTYSGVERRGGAAYTFEFAADVVTPPRSCAP